jgi:hypothetical protein
MALYLLQANKRVKWLNVALIGRQKASQYAREVDIGACLTLTVIFKHEKHHSVKVLADTKFGRQNGASCTG